MRQAGRLSKKLGRKELQDYALRQLGARGHSTAELRTKLARRAGEPADVDAVIGYLREYGFLDDRQFAESFTTARRDREGFGKARVLRDLRQKRVSPELAEKAVGEAYAGVEETELIEAFLERKYRRAKLSELLREPKNLSAAYRRLRYAGFSTGNAVRVLKRYSDQAEQLESMEGEPEDG